MDNTFKYIYIAQATLEFTKCKIGKAHDLDQRLNDYNHTTGRSAENVYSYLFACEVEDATIVENDIKKKFGRLRERRNTEIFFYNNDLFEDYVSFIKSHKLFVEEIVTKTEEPKQITKIVKKAAPTLEERGISRKDVMQKAKKVADDEFYTRYEDIEKEIPMYDKSIWEDKTVFCNCDDAVGDKDTNTSAFALYFIRNFEELGLKKLICTHYGGGIDLFNQGVKGYIFTKNGYEEIGSKESPKGYSGSFDDPISIKILNEEADIVCTNPPFSKAKEYWKLIIESGKKFLIISNITNVKNQPYIDFFIRKLVWAGYNSVDTYLNPKKQIAETAGHWYTNLPVENRPKYRLLKIMPLKKIPEECKYYDDSKMLVVKKGYIPSDYKKPFATSVRPILNGLLEKGYSHAQGKEYVPYINGKRGFGKVLVQKV